MNPYEVFIADIAAIEGKPLGKRAFLKEPLKTATAQALRAMALTAGATDKGAYTLTDGQLIQLYMIACGRRPQYVPHKVAALIQENTLRAPEPQDAPQEPQEPAPAPAPSPAPEAFPEPQDAPLDPVTLEPAPEAFPEPQDAPLIVPIARDLFKPQDGKHGMFGPVLAMLEAGVWPYLVGHAGTGKTTLAVQIAEHLNIPLYCQSSIEHSSELIGFRDMRGDAVNTPFKEAFLNGGLFFFDEMDNSESSALTCFNSAIANLKIMFPDGMKNAHSGIMFMGAGNTNGDGTCMIYNRAKLDNATRDRFAFVTVDYDPKVEEILAKGNTKWLQFIRATRETAFSMPIRGSVVGGPRAIEQGVKLMEVGFTPAQAADMLIYNKVSKTDGERLRERVPLRHYF